MNTPPIPEKQVVDKKLFFLAYDALSYAVGFCEGLDKPCNYAQKQLEKINAELRGEA